MKGAVGNIARDAIMNQLRDMQQEAKGFAAKVAPQGPPKADANGMSFGDHLTQNVKEVNALQKTSDKLAMEIATGKSGNVHEAMLAATQAEMSFSLMVQLRNKALEAYMEIMRMPV